jgi:uncharacterized protein YciI
MKRILPIVLIGCWLLPFTAFAAGSAGTAASAAPPASAAAMPPGMKQYIFAMLKKGPKRDQDEATAAKIQEGHMAHLRQSAKSGKLVIAGPFGDDGDWRGILIYDVPTLDEAKAICEADPAVASGRLVCELHPWWAEKGATLK